MKHPDMTTTPVKPIIGQEALCPDGLGRVKAFSFEMPDIYIQVQTYFNNRECKWDPRNVRLVPFETVSVYSTQHLIHQAIKEHK